MENVQSCQVHKTIMTKSAPFCTKIWCTLMKNLSQYLILIFWYLHFVKFYVKILMFMINICVPWLVSQNENMFSITHSVIDFNLFVYLYKYFKLIIFYYLKVVGKLILKWCSLLLVWHSYSLCMFSLLWILTCYHRQLNVLNVSYTNILASF